LATTTLTHAYGTSSGAVRRVHGLRHCDLPETGAQSMASAVLARKRAVNLGQTLALVRRVYVSMEKPTA
jgi:antitoxin component HigA of HigAB toxin-antitoxin module